MGFSICVHVFSKTKKNHQGHQMPQLNIQFRIKKGQFPAPFLSKRCEASDSGRSKEDTHHFFIAMSYEPRHTTDMVYIYTHITLEVHTFCYIYNMCVYIHNITYNASYVIYHLSYILIAMVATHSSTEFIPPSVKACWKRRTSPGHPMNRGESREGEAPNLWQNWRFP